MSKLSSYKTRKLSVSIYTARPCMPEAVLFSKGVKTLLPELKCFVMLQLVFTQSFIPWGPAFVGMLFTANCLFWNRLGKRWYASYFVTSWFCVSIIHLKLLTAACGSDIRAGKRPCPGQAPDANQEIGALLYTKLRYLNLGVLSIWTLSYLIAAASWSLISL